MIETSQMKHVACIWWNPHDHFDFLAVLYQKHDETWLCLYRFRYYDRAGDSRDPFLSKDTKNWYEVTNGYHDARMFEEKLDVVFRKSLEDVKDFKKIEVRGDVKKFLDIMSKQPWCHVKMEFGSI